MYTLALPRAKLVEFELVRDLAGQLVVDSMEVYAKPVYSNHPTFDALNCGNLWFQVSCGSCKVIVYAFARFLAWVIVRKAWLCLSGAVLMLLFWL